MGIVDMFRKTKEESKNKINLTKNPELNRKISLRKDILVCEVKKNNISSLKARVVFALDHSGSMRNLYKNGAVQTLLERIFPMAMYFDDNCEMEFYWFDSLFKELIPVNCGNLENYVEDVILARNEHFGGTCYAPVMNQIFSRYALKNPSVIPTFVIFITDGSNSDKKATKDILVQSSKYNIFWKFIGIGNEKFEFLEKLDSLKGRFIDNANFINIHDIEKADDSEFYHILLEEYEQWLQLCRNNGIIVS